MDQALAALMPEYSRSRLQSWIKDGYVTLNGQAVAAKQVVWEGDQIDVQMQQSAEVQAFQPENIALDILYEDEAILVVNKPAGLVVHPGSGNWQGTMLNALLHHAPQLAEVPRAGIVHRLDKDTSGLLVVAKTLVTQTNLVRQLQARSVKREYLAVVQGMPQEEGSVDEPIGRHPSQRIKMAVVSNGKPAITHFSVLERFARHSLVSCRLETGRTHQIRVHMQHIGFPLLGDPVYGGRGVAASARQREAIASFGRQALHATRLGLLHPSSGEIQEWNVEMPSDMALIIDTLRSDER